MAGIYEPDYDTHTRRDPRFAEYGAELDSTAPAPSRAWRLLYRAFEARRRGFEHLAGRLAELAVEEARRGKRGEDYKP